MSAGDWISVAASILAMPIGTYIGYRWDHRARRQGGDTA